MLTAAPFIGLALSRDPSLATLPIAVQFGATLVTTMPASLLMKHVGRRLGFLLGTLFAIAGSATAAYGIWVGSFALFCTGLALNGIFNGFGTYFRFAAADAAGAEYRSRAVSYVLAGGVVAALLGPNLARFTVDTVPSAPFTGTYIGLVAVYCIALLALLFVDIPKPTAQERAAGGRPLLAIARQPAFAMAVAAGMIGFGVMNLVMTSTPLAMHEHAYPFSDAAFIIQWHVLAMFLPSFFTGRLIARYGVLPIMQIGALLCAFCAGVNLLSLDLWVIWLALVALGLGWNFLFIGATTLLTETYRPEERAKTQGLNDFLILGTTTITAFSSAPLHHYVGWSLLNASTLPLLVFTVAAIAWLKLRQRAAVAATAVQDARE
jgi:MFS family permease